MPAPMNTGKRNNPEFLCMVNTHQPTYCPPTNGFLSESPAAANLAAEVRQLRSVRDSLSRQLTEARVAIALQQAEAREVGTKQERQRALLIVNSCSGAGKAHLAAGLVSSGASYRTVLTAIRGQ